MTHAPAPLPRACRERSVEAIEPRLSGFVFKIQANMDPGHRDRIAFLRLCSGRYQRGMRIRHVRLDKELRIADALTFMAADRTQAEEAYAGDIIGLHNHGTINIGDSFSEGESLHFTGIPNFAPEIFRRAVLKDPLRMKALAKGLDQLCEEGATQLFRPLRNADLILGAVGQLQFEVVAFRLADEYGVQCVFDTIGVHTARWVSAANARKLEEFRARAYDHLALDHARRAGLPRPLAGQPAAHARALAGDRLPRDARAGRGLRVTNRGSARAAQWAWGMSAWANHAFSTTVLVGLFPIFFDKYWAAALAGTRSTFYLGLANSGASLRGDADRAMARHARGPPRSQEALVRGLHRARRGSLRPRWR